MRQKLWCICLLLLTVLAGGTVSADQDHRKTEDAFDKMMREGWKLVAPGVLQRSKSGNQVETFAIGPEGMQWALQQLKARLRFLRREYGNYPSSDLLGTIASLRQEIVRLQEDLERLEVEGELLEEVSEKDECIVLPSASASVSSLSLVQGVTATASASFESTCDYEADVYAYAYSRATQGTISLENSAKYQKHGNHISGSVTQEMRGGPDCLSEAYAHVIYQGMIVSSQPAILRNTLCPAITGPSTISFSSPADTCVSTTWSTSDPGGIPPYSYAWSVDGERVGDDASYTRQVCPSDASFDLSVILTDSTQIIASDGTSSLQSAALTLPVTVISPLVLGPIMGPTNILFASSGAACESKTWSASASGGTTPYSYKWSIDGIQVGTGTSYTRQVCPSDASLTLTATVTDSTAPQQSSSQSLAITVNPMTLAPITGPTSILFTSSAASCVSQVWSTLASGGTSPYSYRWWIDGMLVGTGTTYTRQVCPSDARDASYALTATVKDTSTPTPRTDTQTLLVKVSVKLALTITGPTAVAFTSSTAACTPVTWSASVSSGTSPYSYVWSVNGIQAGTGTSYTRQVCPSDADFILAATVADSGSPSQSATQSWAVDVNPLVLAAISGPTSISFTSSAAACVNRTWSTSASGGETPYSYKWSVGGAQVGTGASYTRQVCPTHASFTLTATATDNSASQQNATKTQAVTVSVTPPPPSLAQISGPTSVSFTSSAAACVNKTWSTSASNGTPPYSYKWSVGGAQVGTGTSYTRQVCPSHASFTLTATVTDSTTPTAQSDSRNRAVTITVEPSAPLLSVSITGPAQAYFGTANCATYTWTASVSGGTPAYSYKWMVGTTQVGTGSSYSRSVCYNHADFTLSLTVTDSGTPTPQSKSATQTIAVSYEPTTCGGTRINPLMPCDL